MLWGAMRETSLSDGRKVWCLRSTEARVLDSHVEGYFRNGVAIAPGDTIIDVGANIGIFGVRAIDRHVDVKVYALEPVPEIFSVLQRNAEAHGSGRLIALQCGASDKAGSTTFTYFPRSPALSTSDPGAWEEDPSEFTEAVAGATRTAPMWYARLVPRFLSGAIARHLRAKSIEVQATLRTISDIIDEHEIDSVALLKVDCEGGELPTLRGIREEHWPRVRQVVVEIHDRNNRLETIVALLKSRGLTGITTEQEAGFEATRLVNLYAVRPAP